MNRNLLPIRFPITRNPLAILFWVVVGFTILLILYPISFLLFGSVWSTRPGREGSLTLVNYIDVFSDPHTLTLLINSSTYALGSALLAITIATGLAFITTRTDAPFRNYFRYVPILPIILPGMVDNLAWIFIFRPNTGLVNVWFRDTFGLSSDFVLFNIYSMPGMIWVMGISLAPLAYLVISAAFYQMDPSLEESGRIAGMRLRTIVRKITIPLMMPAILSVFFLVFIIAFESFETPAMIGLPAGIDVFMSNIYQAIVWSIPPNYGLATANASILLVVTVTLIYLYRRATKRAEKFQIITGRGYQPRLMSLGRWKYFGTAILVGYVILHIGIVFSMVFLLSLQPFWDPHALFSRITFEHYAAVLGRSSISRALINSIIVSTITATVVVTMAALVSYISRKSKFKRRGFLEGVGMLPLAFPGFVIGLGFLWMFLTLPIASLVYGTLGVFVLAFLVKYLPHGIRFTSGAVMQIHNDLEESSAIAGAAWTRTVRKVTMPLLRPAMLAGWVYVFVVSFRELSSVIFLITARNQVLSTVLWDLFQNGSVELLAAASILLTIFLWSVVVIAMVIFRLKLR